MIFYTYIYYDPGRNNEPIYVGKGKEYRAWCHLYRKDTHPLTQRLNLMKRNNILPNIGFYSEMDEELALLVEIELIAKLGRKDLGLGPLLNLTDGGDGIYNISQEIKDKISNSKKGSIPWNLGKPHTQETRDKISKSNTGNTLSDQTRFRMSAASRGKPKSAEHNANVAKSKTGVKRAEFSEEWKQKMSATHKARWAKIKENKDKNNDI